MGGLDVLNDGPRHGVGQEPPRDRESLKLLARWLARAVPAVVILTFLLVLGRGDLALLFLGFSVAILLGAIAGILGWFARPSSPPSLVSIIVPILAMGVGALFFLAFMWLYAFEHDFTF